MISILVFNKINCTKWCLKIFVLHVLGKERGGIKIKSKMMKDFINLTITNLIGLLMGVLSSFITPVVLGHTQYGYYKIFSLYTTYAPLLHVGFIDGILAVNAGKKLENISLKKFRAYTRFIIIFEAMISLIMILYAILIDMSWINREIIIALSIYDFIFNMVTYFQFFSKCIMEFDRLAGVTRLQSYVSLIYLLIAFAIYKFSYLNINASYYLFFVNFTQFIVLLWYGYSYKYIIFGDRYSIKHEKNKIINFFKLGFLIMISYQITMFIINADNQFISMFFDVSQYGEYAFAYSMAALLITVFSAISSMMLPYMKKTGKKAVLQEHDYNLSVMCLIVFLVLFSYYPIVLVTKSFLPAYYGSIGYLKIVFPGVGITCIIQSYLFNNYILIKKVKIFCALSLFNLVFDFGLYYILYVLFHNVFIIAIASLPLLLMWYLTLEVYMRRIEGIKVLKNFVYLLILSVMFVFFNHVYVNILISAVSYLIYYLIVSYLFFSDNIKKMLKDKM